MSCIAEALHQSLIRLDLTGCSSLSDLGLIYIASKCHAIENLNISNCYITDTGIGFITAGCPKIQVLKISNCTNLTDTSLFQIATIEQLQVFDCTGCTKFTDCGLQKIASSCTQLKELELYNCTQFTTECIQSLKLSLTCVVHLQYMPRINIRCLQEISDGDKLFEKELSNLWFNYCWDYANQLEHSLLTADESTGAMHADSILGSCANIGAPIAKQLAADIFVHCRSRRFEEALQLLQKLKHEIFEANIELEQYLNKYFIDWFALSKSIK